MSRAESVPRKRPRKCVGCGGEGSKGALLRVVRSPEGAVSVNLAGKAPGRGAYICANADCIEAARKKNALSRSLKQPVDKEVYSKLREYVERSDGDDEGPAD